ncbi:MULTISPECIES: YggT family protein [unclassified Gordonia (in: high G+C Gram-positive bacteria)]|uniref:YggT family protein n=1 Tax=unclassified Gordonia (in: high G+C Gram-positive bacteria) TaxID=2657482 RepID=UPI001FFFDBC8|nr:MULTISPECIES: YggT family protein [unclassified Gordonia (in: high G+C Gram-positive bacteria)]UQE73576.1 YggT family protein [Gordonia sp. PP30]
MVTFLWILYLVLFLYWLLLIARLVVEFVQSIARRWRPRGFTVVVVETVFTLTDPPLKAIRRVLKPVDLGSVRLDLSLFLVLIVVSIGMSISRTYATVL